MHSPIKRAWFGKYKFDIIENVFEPSEDTFLFAENLDIKENDAVLDMGAGCGILGILATQKAQSVISVDINPHAVRCAKENANINHARGKMAFMQADLLSAFNEATKFDLILFNAPYLPSDPGESVTWIELAWAGGASGREIVDRFIPQAALHLKPLGRILMLQSTLTNVELTIRKFEECRLKACVKAQQKLPFFETITLIEAKAEV
jgi:release factor glutamine methyltransferase